MLTYGGGEQKAEEGGGGGGWSGFDSCLAGCRESGRCSIQEYTCQLLQQLFTAGGALDTTRPIFPAIEHMVLSCLSGALPFAQRTQLLGLPAQYVSCSLQSDGSPFQVAGILFKVGVLFAGLLHGSRHLCIAQHAIAILVSFCKHLLQQLCRSAPITVLCKVPDPNVTSSSGCCSAHCHDQWPDKQ